MADTYVPGGENDPIKQALALEEERMKVFEARMAPMLLFAPTNGVVTMIYRHAGEQVLAGEPIAIVTATNSQRIVGCLPQYYPVEPRVGMAVQVRTRSARRKAASARIIGVSPYFEPMTNVLMAPMILGRASVVPMGRIVSVSMPRELNLRPGEPVDVTLLGK